MQMKCKSPESAGQREFYLILSPVSSLSAVHDEDEPASSLRTDAVLALLGGASSSQRSDGEGDGGGGNTRTPMWPAPARTSSCVRSTRSSLSFTASSGDFKNKNCLVYPSFTLVFVDGITTYQTYCCFFATSEAFYSNWPNNEFCRLVSAHLQLEMPQPRVSML